MALSQFLSNQGTQTGIIVDTIGGSVMAIQKVDISPLGADGTIWNGNVGVSSGTINSVTTLSNLSHGTIEEAVMFGYNGTTNIAIKTDTPGNLYTIGTLLAGTINTGTINAGTINAATVTAGSIVVTAGTLSTGTINTGTINSATISAGSIVVTAGTVSTGTINIGTVVGKDVNAALQTGNPVAIGGTDSGGTVRTVLVNSAGAMSVSGASAGTFNNISTGTMQTLGTVGTLQNILAGTITALQNGTINAGSIVVTAGTVVNNGGSAIAYGPAAAAAASSGNPLNIGGTDSGGTIRTIKVDSGGLQRVGIDSGTITVLPNLPQGSITVTTGTIVSVGTIGTLGLGTITGNLGTIGTLGLGTVVSTGTVNVGTINTGTINTGTVQVTAGTIMGSWLEQLGSATAAGADIIPSFDTSNYKWISIEMLNTFVGTAQWQISNDNVNFQAQPLANMGNTQSPTTTLLSATNTIWHGPIVSRYGRLRVSSYTSGTLQAAAELYTIPSAMHNFGVTAAVASGTVTSITNLAAGTVTALASGTITSGSITVTAGTIASVGTIGTLGLGTVVSTGTVNVGTINTGTINTGTINAGTINTGTINAGTINAGTFQQNPIPTVAHSVWGTHGTTGVSLVGTLVGGTGSGAGTEIFVTSVSMSIPSTGGSQDVSIGWGTAAGTFHSGTSMIVRGNFPAGGGIQKTFEPPINSGTNAQLGYFQAGAGTVDIAVSYILTPSTL